MKYLMYNCFFLLIVLIFAYVNSMPTKETFTPQIKQFYRPYVRNGRIITENFYNQHKNNISNLFRKFGLM